MEANTQKEGKQLEALLNEAKVYNSMGLYEESRQVYDRILSEFPDLPDHSRDLLQEHIDQLDQEINERNGYDMEALLTDEEISFIRQEFLKTGESDGSHEQAVIFMETGQYAEAMEEFRRLLSGGTHPERFLGHLVECVLRLYGPDEAPARIEDLGAETSLGKRERAQLKFKLGDELEKDQRIEAAIEMYRSARRIIPEDLKMRSALDDKLAGLSKDSRYAYLLNQGWITKDDIADAEKQARTARSSLDAVLMDAFNISKEDLGRSLSLYYDVPFKTYDPNTMAPVDLMVRLHRGSLEKEGWVPIAAYENEVDVLMEHPDDAETTLRVRELLNAGSLNLSVGVREDIGLYLDRFFREAQLVAETAQAKGRSAPGSPRKTRRERRSSPAIPDFVYVEFSVEAGSKPPQNCRLDVLNCSENGIGLLVPQKDLDPIKTLDPGTVIPNMIFYAPWTLIQADATVRHLTLITTGRHNGDYILGVESDEIVESSRMP